MGRHHSPPRSTVEARSTRRRLAWTRLTDQELLAVRLCDLKLTIENSRLAPYLERLYRELESRGIDFRPHAWLSEEWFSPDGVPGIAVPFYLAHPRLERLERRVMRGVEGGNSRWLMRILRHEAGHAFDNAYRLRRRRRWREVFGPASLPYPDRYRARAGSRRYVHHLGEWYAQAHPTEDFAETFAVWLKPNSDWRKTYAAWPALQKLSLVDELVTSVRGSSPPVRNRLRVDPIATDTRTLADVYRRKLAHNRQYGRGLAEELLLKVFSVRPERAGALRAATLIRLRKSELLAFASRELGIERYSVHQILRMLIERCDALKLHVRGSRRDAARHVRWILGRIARLYAQGATPHLPL
ncbi:MAG TPA: putative zinc-binding metallopeptidase [Steroidobacteraceae bacterium]|nr:putative zinc-binding metallopeptidase [Steroidobacteraceae bacterium]